MYRFIIDWAEVLAPLIALPFVFRKDIPAYLRPIKVYVIIALIINIAATIIWKFKEPWGFQPGDFLWSNNFLYNIHSIARLFLFSIFFILLNQRFLHRVKRLIPFIFLGFVLINFIFFENFLDRGMFSNRLLATEAALLLFYCLQYFIFLNLEERSLPLKKEPGFWIVTGLTFYVAASFFIYLFYIYLTAEDLNFAVDIWDVHNIMYLVLCICIAITFTRKYE
jgi:hypothetical protein